MKGVLNSELDPSELVVDSSNSGLSKLANALSQPEYLIAIFQRNFYNTFRYDLESPDWEDITPNQYRKKIRELLEKLEDKIWMGLTESEEEMRTFIKNSKT